MGACGGFGSVRGPGPTILELGHGRNGERSALDRALGRTSARRIHQRRDEAAETEVRRVCSEARTTQAYSQRYVEEAEREQARRTRGSAAAVGVAWVFRAGDGESAGIRTQDPRLKRAMLYRLSYRLTEQDAELDRPLRSHSAGNTTAIALDHANGANLTIARFQLTRVSAGLRPFSTAGLQRVAENDGLVPLGAGGDHVDAALGQFFHAREIALRFCGELLVVRHPRRRSVPPA